MLQAKYLLVYVNILVGNKGHCFLLQAQQVTLSRQSNNIPVTLGGDDL